MGRLAEAAEPTHAPTLGSGESQTTGTALKMISSQGRPVASRVEQATRKALLSPSTVTHPPVSLDRR